jgi:hypothetical protein
MLAAAQRRPYDQLVPEYDAFWMHPSPPRDLPLQRAARAVAVQGPGRRQGRLSPVSDADPMAVPDGQVPPSYRRVWERLHGQLHLPREAISTVWRMLHGQLYCGAFRVRVNRSLPLRQACCMQPGCAGHLDTLTHSFMRCPAVAPAMGWLLGVWAAVAGVPPPADPRVLLADDDRVWQPSVGGVILWPLWTALRVLFLHGVWRCRVAQRVSGQPFTAGKVVALTIAALRRVMQQDWARARHLPFGEPDLDTHWVGPGASNLSVPGFVSKWCHGGVLAQVLPGHGPKPELLLRLSFAWPVLAPVVPADAAGGSGPGPIPAGAAGPSGSGAGASGSGAGPNGVGAGS